MSRSSIVRLDRPTTLQKEHSLSSKSPLLQMLTFSNTPGMVTHPNYAAGSSWWNSLRVELRRKRVKVTVRKINLPPTTKTLTNNLPPFPQSTSKVSNYNPGRLLSTGTGSVKVTQKGSWIRSNPSSRVLLATPSEINIIHPISTLEAKTNRFNMLAVK